MTRRRWLCIMRRARVQAYQVCMLFEYCGDKFDRKRMTSAQLVDQCYKEAGIDLFEGET